jgi:hypothetical protein
MAVADDHQLRGIDDHGDLLADIITSFRHRDCSEALSAPQGVHLQANYAYRTCEGIQVSLPKDP